MSRSLHACPHRWFRRLQRSNRHLLLKVVTLVALSFSLASNNRGQRAISFCRCEASIFAPATRTTVAWNDRRRGLQQHVTSRVKLASSTVTKKIHQISNDVVDDDGYDHDDEINKEPIGLAGYREEYATEGGNDDDPLALAQEEIEYGHGQSFVFRRFQSLKAIRKALDPVRSTSSFKWFEGKDGRKGYVSSTKLGGDYVLAESEQVAVDCTAEDVLRVYLTGELQARWNAKNLKECYFTKRKKTKNSGDNPLSSRPAARKVTRNFNVWSRKQPNDDGDGDAYTGGQSQEQKYVNHGDPRNACDTYFYIQDLLLRSQRVIRSHTGPMRYQQIIEIDKVGRHNYSILVQLSKNKDSKYRSNNVGLLTATAKKPFESLQVYVGLEQVGKDVKIYAAGVFEVCREVVPKIIVFDTSGIAGSIAGKGTLWLAPYFEQRSKRHNVND